MRLRRAGRAAVLNASRPVSTPGHNTQGGPVQDQTWLETINQNVQNRLAQSALRGRQVELRRRPDYTLEIVVDGKVYPDLAAVDDEAVRDLLRATIDAGLDDARLASLLHARPLARRPASGIVGSKWLVVCLTVTVIVLVAPMCLIEPMHIAGRSSLVEAGSLAGGLVGAVAGRTLAQRIRGHKRLGATMIWGLLGGVVGIPLGYTVTAAILSLIP